MKKILESDLWLQLAEGAEPDSLSSHFLCNQIKNLPVSEEWEIAMRKRLDQFVGCDFLAWWVLPSHDGHVSHEWPVEFPTSMGSSSQGRVLAALICYWQCLEEEGVDLDSVAAYLAS